MMTKALRLAAALFLTTPFFAAAAIPPAENLLPQDTLTFFTLPDCATARVTAKTTPMWMFWNDAAMKPFHDRFMAKWDEQFIAPLERDLGINPADFASLPQGQFTFAVTVNGSNGNDDIPPGLLLLLDARDRGTALKTNLAVLVKKWTDAGRTLRKEQIHGLTFTVVTLSSNDLSGFRSKKPQVSEIGKDPEKDEKKQKPDELYFAQYESLLVAGNSPKVVEPVLAHLTGGSIPAIADNAVFAADKLAQFRDTPRCYGWFNGKAFFDLLAHTSSDTDDDSPSLFSGLSPAKVLEVLGLSAIKSVSFALHDTAQGSTFTLHVTAPEPERAGLVKILAIPPKDAGVPQFVPADAVKFTRVRLDGKQTWAEIQKIVAGFSPSAENSLNMLINYANMAGQKKDPAFDLRHDLFGNLNDDLISYQKPAADSGNPPTIYLLSVANPETMINAFKTLIGMNSSSPEAEAQPREFQGHKIHVIALKPLRVANAAQPRSLYLSSCGGYVALSDDSAILEEFLRNADGQNKALRENPALADALQHLGGTGGGLFGYENQRETMRVKFKALKNLSAADGAMKAFPPLMRDWLDFSLLPDYDAVAKYFYLTAFAGTANAGGMTCTFYTPRPPRLK